MAPPVARSATNCVISSLLILVFVISVRAGLAVPSLSEQMSPPMLSNDIDDLEFGQVSEKEVSRQASSSAELASDNNFREKYHKLKERLLHGHLAEIERVEEDLEQATSQLQSPSQSRSRSKSQADNNNNNQKQTPSNLSPVILVPGYGGSRLEGKRDKKHVKHYFCDKHTDWSNIWVDLKLMLPYMIDCLIEDFRLEFDGQTNTTHNTEGVEIRVRDPEDLLSVEYIADIHLPSFGYFAPIIRKLTHAFNYQRNYNIRGAPYDFRKAPNELGEYFANLRRECEQLRDKFQQPVSFVCHSMGCNNVLYFLQRQSPEWKDKHIKRVVSLAAPWGGSMQALRAAAIGDNLGLPYLFDEAELKIVQQSVPSTMYLFPSERVFQEAPLIRTHTSSSSSGSQTETLSAHDYKRFFELINHPDGYMMWLNTKDLLGQLEPPQVEVWCLYGLGQPTLGRMEFKGEFPSSQEEDFHEDGDGTVTVTSSSFCKQWTSQQKQPIHPKAFQANHVNIIKDPAVLDMIEQIFSQQ